MRSRRARRRGSPFWPCDDNTASMPPTLQRPRGRRNRRRRAPLRGKGAPRDRYRWCERRSTAGPACLATPARMRPHRQGSTHPAPKPVVPAHLRRVLQRADVRRVRMLFARSPGIASHDADPPSGRRPARQRGRLVRIRVHFGAADDRGEGPLRESNGCLCVDLRDENDITSASFSSNIISCDRYALSMLAVVSSCRLGSDSASCVRCRA